MGARLDPGAIFAVLNAHGVDYVVVGGFAAVTHGVPRTTFDVDIVADRTRENLNRLAGAMDDLGAPKRVSDSANFLELDPRDAFDLARGRITRIDTQFGPLDVLADPPGALAFSDLLTQAERITTSQAVVPVVSRQHLLVLKQASGRDKDLMDLADLERDV